MLANLKFWKGKYHCSEKDQKSPKFSWNHEFDNQTTNDWRHMGQGENSFTSIQSWNSHELRSLFRLSMLRSDHLKVLDSIEWAYKIIWKVWIWVLSLVQFFKVLYFSCDYFNCIEDCIRIVQSYTIKLWLLLWKITKLRPLGTRK